MLSFVELLSGLCLYIGPYIFFHKAFTSHAATCCASIAHNITNKCQSTDVPCPNSILIQMYMYN